MAEHKPILSVRIDKKLMDRLDALVEQTGVGRAEIVERCLSLGIVDQEEFVAELRSSVRGPLLALLMHPKVLNVIMSLTGGVIDETQQKIKGNVRAGAGANSKRLKPAR